MAGNIRAFLAELIGTFAWVFFSAGAISSLALQGDPRGLFPALANGLAVATAFALFGQHTPGMFNPAVTLSLAFFKRLDWVKAALCIVCQLLGATLAGILLAKLFFPHGIVSAPPYLGTPVAAGLGFRGATLLEAILTFFLTLAVLRDWTAMAPPARAGAAIIVGIIVAAATAIGAPLSGAAMNPARAFGTAMGSGIWLQQYIYWIGPTAGAVAGTALSQFLFKK